MVCPVCIAAPLIVGSAMGAGIAVSNKNLYLYIFTLFVTLVGLLVYIYYTFYKKCDTCIAPPPEN